MCIVVTAALQKRSGAAQGMVRVMTNANPVRSEPPSPFWLARPAHALVACNDNVPPASSSGERGKLSWTGLALALGWCGALLWTTYYLVLRVSH